ncbi:unnamed protein product [Penicillium salamii]|uniref:Uncharacterized protein n=1 Tax=Penicillium salamii TaxID=1612424 RepID=A0A9W4IJ37_9EURO|nr:unnamed protein product [Penicillium salamii]CAG8100039.1 unnamed protein product [Penicillium salamii]CAG8106340.1 unnamed protein product [Penicillium salamii]CAG8116235.1 unnamed protein product [Penicillium salamii]CAG8287168.1 unnamed protein product [Penicillium salamii]
MCYVLATACISLHPGQIPDSLQLDSYAAAENSSFNITHSRNKYTTRSRWGNSSSYGGGGGGGGDGPGSGPRRVGRIDDFRGATDSSGPRCGGGCG